MFFSSTTSQHCSSIRKAKDLGILFFLGLLAQHVVLSSFRDDVRLGCALTFASEAKFEIEAKISFRLEAKKKPDFT
jgi:hypothetical protein